MSKRALFSKLGKSRNHSSSRYDSFDDPGSPGSDGDQLPIATSGIPSSIGGTGGGVPASAFASVEMPESSFPSPPTSPDSSTESSQFLKKRPRSVKKYASLDDNRATQLEAVGHDVFIVHKGWKDDMDIVTTIAEKLHASPMKLSCVTLATSKTSGVVMSSFPPDPSIPDLTAEHTAAMAGFTRCLDKERGPMTATSAPASSSRQPSSSTVAAMMIRGSQTPPATRSPSCFPTVARDTRTSRAMSVGRRKGQKMGTEAGAFDVNVKLMIERFNTAKVVVILYDRQWLSALPEPLVGLACVQHKFLVPVAFMGQQGLLTQLSSRATYAFSTSKFFFVDRATRNSQFVGVVEHVIGCLRPSARNPLSLPCPESIFSSAQDGDSADADDPAVPVTDDLIQLSDGGHFPAPRQPQAMTIDDLLGLGNDFMPLEKNPTMMPLAVADQQAPENDDDDDEDNADKSSALRVGCRLDDKTTGEALWRHLFPRQPPAARCEEVQASLRRRCNEPMARLFRRDLERDATALALATALCTPPSSSSSASDGDDDGDAGLPSLTHDDFVRLVQEQLTGDGSRVVLEKAMEASNDESESLDVLLWFLLARWMAELQCRQA